mmetsp:Transcript_18286/g.50955  ORF Transcript_18286/g.50955 Transcript_18286/m.50955 type:complete len:164 (-) Transcript_18286:1294-1785(-)
MDSSFFRTRLTGGPVAPCLRNEQQHNKYTTSTQQVHKKYKSKPASNTANPTKRTLRATYRHCHGGLEASKKSLPPPVVHPNQAFLGAKEIFGTPEAPGLQLSRAGIDARGDHPEFLLEVVFAKGIHVQRAQAVVIAKDAVKHKRNVHARWRIEQTIPEGLDPW